MNGLEKIPSEKEREKVYEILQGLRSKKTSQEITPNKLALYIQWTRFDPRLAEIIVGYIVKNWIAMNPMSLNDCLKKQPWPQAGGVILEFAKKAIDLKTRKKFSYWSNLVTSDFQKAPLQQFFIGLRKVGGKEMLSDARFASDEYQKWGYLAKEVLFNKSKFGVKYDPEVRKEILKDLLTRNQKMTTRQYHNILGQGITIRQAERDILKWQNILLVVRNNTRARKIMGK